MLKRNFITEVERYAFETTGLLIIRDFIDKDERDRLVRAMPDQTGLYFHNAPEFCMEYMAHPLIIECCSKFIGPWFRFDHELAVVQREDAEPYLHGGQFGSHGTCFHHPVEKSSWNGQVTVGIALTAQNENTGGFAYIPGSQHYIGGGQFGTQHVFWKYLLGNNDLVVTPRLEMGDLYIFSEALVHGQIAWSKHNILPRWTAYIKYVPGYMAWQNPECNKQYEKYASTPQQFALLEPPYVRDGLYNSTKFRKSIRMAGKVNHEHP